MEQDLLLDEVIGYVKKLCGNDYKVIVETIEIENGLGYTCIFRKNCASVPEERSAIPLQTEQSSAG